MSSETETKAPVAAAAPEIKKAAKKLTKKVQKKSSHKRTVPRLHVQGNILGYKRALRTQNPNISLIKIQGCDTKEAAMFYRGKKVAFVNKLAKDYKVNWGKVQRPHGSNGVVRVNFRRNLPPQSIGGKVRVMLYPSNT